MDRAKKLLILIAVKLNPYHSQYYIKHMSNKRVIVIMDTNHELAHLEGLEVVGHHHQLLLQLHGLDLPGLSSLLRPLQISLNLYLDIYFYFAFINFSSTTCCSFFCTSSYLLSASSAWFLMPVHQKVSNSKYLIVLKGDQEVTTSVNFVSTFSQISYRSLK